MVLVLGTVAAVASIEAYWVCGGGDSVSNGLYTMCDTYDTYALNGTCINGRPKQLMFCQGGGVDQVRPVTKLRHVNGLLQWQIYTFNGALKPLVYHYTAPARLDCITSPVYPVSSGWKNVTPGTGLMLVLTSSRSHSTVALTLCLALHLGCRRWLCADRRQSGRPDYHHLLREHTCASIFCVERLHNMQGSLPHLSSWPGGKSDQVLIIIKSCFA